MNKRLEQELETLYTEVDFPWYDFTITGKSDIRKLCETVANHFYHLGLQDVKNEAEKEIGRFNELINKPTTCSIDKYSLGARVANCEQIIVFINEQDN